MADKSSLLLKQEILELTKENKALKETIVNLLEQLNVLKLNPINPIDNKISNEMQIIEKQIELLNEQSKMRALSLEETRGLDLLIKNKKLLENKKSNEDEDKVPDGQDTSDLLRIVGNVESIERTQPKTGKKDTMA